MRTTIDLDADVLQAAKELARSQRSTVGQVISALSRQALSTPSSPTQGPLRNGVPVLPVRSGEVVTLEQVRTLEESD